MRKLLALITAAAFLPMLAAQAKDKPAPVSTTFTVDATTKIRVGDNKQAALADVKTGDKVHITYHDNAGTLVADRVGVQGEKKADKPADKPATGDRKKREPKPGELHAGGVVTAVDASTLTVDVRPPREKK
jgi:hypothetical protein